MYLEDKIEEIDLAISSFICRNCEGQTSTVIKNHGLCREQWNQNNNAVLLHESFENESGDRSPVVYDDTKTIQTIHVITGTTPASSSVFGGFQKTALNYNLKLIIISKFPDIFERCVKALNSVQDILYLSSVNSVESVMKSELKTVIGNGKNYPPELYAFMINYQVLSIVPFINEC